MLKSKTYLKKSQLGNNKILFHALDSLRGLAAIAIVVYHFSGGCAFSGSWGGYLAVDFFLVLSGFILSHNYLYRSDVDSISFVESRLARLYPLHIYSLFTFFIVFVVVNHKLPSYQDGTLFTLFQQITLTQNIGLNPHELTWNEPSWSISVEFWVNIIFILFITKIIKNITLFLLSLLGLIVIYYNTGHIDTHSTNYYGFINSGLLRGIASFFLGIIAYRIYLYFKDAGRFKKLINYLEIVSVIGVIVILFGRTGKHSGIDIFSPFLFMVVVVIFSYELGWLSKSLKKLKYLGTISYSIYLNQFTVIMVLRYILYNLNTPPLLFLAIYILILLPYSHFTYKYIEKPLRSRGKHLISRITHRSHRSSNGQ